MVKRFLLPDRAPAAQSLIDGSCRGTFDCMHDLHDTVRSLIAGINARRKDQMNMIGHDDGNM
jgi:hypothetical protein